jgi:hypothetical protein
MLTCAQSLRLGVFRDKIRGYRVKILLVFVVFGVHTVVKLQVCTIEMLSKMHQYLSNSCATIIALVLQNSSRHH